MKKIKIILFFLTLTSLFSEKMNAQKKNPSVNKTQAKLPNRDDQVTRIGSNNEQPIPYYIGMGNEPGWSLELSQGQDASFEATLLMDYGAAKYKGNLKKTTLTFGDSFREVIMGDMTDGKSKVPVEIQIIEGDCRDDADQNHEAMTALKFGDRNLNGCGDFAANMALELNGRYKVTAINGDRVKQDNQLKISVFERKISGKMGCNNMNSYFMAKKDGSVSKMNFAATRMLCKDMKLEQTFSQVIQKVAKYFLDKKYLVFLDANDNKIIELQRVF
jgi:heat shock protein HslJ